MSPPYPSREGGFILVAVLVMLVVIGLLAAAVATVSERAVASAAADAAAFQAEIDMAGTRDTLLFMLSTQRMTAGGLTVDDRVAWTAGEAVALRPDEFGDSLPPPLPVGNEIRLDGTPYGGLGAVEFSLQDDGGLYSPNWAYDLYRPGFFGVLGAAPSVWEGLEAKRLDYQDPDTLFRLNGGEDEAYRAAALPPPRNAPLATPLELRRVLGWHQLVERREDNSLMHLITAGRTTSINVNTAPPEVLRAIPGVDEATAKRIVALRERLPFMLPWQFIAEFGLPLDDMAPLQFLPVGYGTLHLWQTNGGPVRVLHWTLTPADEGGRPWRLDYEIVLPRERSSDSSLARPAQTPLLPDKNQDQR